MDVGTEKSARELYEEAQEHLNEMERIIEGGEKGESSLMLSRAKVFYVNTVGQCRTASRNNPAGRISQAKFRKLDERYKGLCSRGEIPTSLRL
jgi:hypothetical protein